MAGAMGEMRPGSAPNGAMRLRYGEMREALLATEPRPAWRPPRLDASTCQGLLATPAALGSLGNLRRGLSLNDGRLSLEPRSPRRADGSRSAEVQTPTTVLCRSESSRPPTSAAARRIQRSTARRAERERQKRAKPSADSAGADAGADAGAAAAAEHSGMADLQPRVYPAGAVRVPEGQEQDGRLTPEPRFRAFSPLFPSESFVSKQAELEPHNDGDRESPALLSAYWPKPIAPNRVPRRIRPSPRHAARAPRRRQPITRRQDETMILMELVKLRLRYALKDGRSWHNIFDKYDADNSGSLDYAQFTKVIREGGRLSQDKLSDKALRDVFDHVDLAASGVISFEEFEVFVSSENPYFEVHVESLKQRLRASAPSTDELVQIFAYYDADHTGLLDQRELRALIRREATVTEEQLSDMDIEKLFCVMDAGQDGQISIDDFMMFLKSVSARFVRVVEAAKKKMLNAVPPGVDWEAIFTGADRDHSGHLSLPEMVMAVRMGANVPVKTLSDFEVEALFYSIDNDGSQAVTITEFMAFLTSKNPVADKLIQTKMVSQRKKLARTSKPTAASTSAASEVVELADLAGVAAETKPSYGRNPKKHQKKPRVNQKMTFKKAGRGIMVTNRLRAFDINEAHIVRCMHNARELSDMGEAKQAVKLIASVLDEHPNIPPQNKCQIYVMQSICVAKTGDLWSALQLAEHAVQQDPRSVRAQQRRAYAQAALGRPARAIVGLCHGLTVEPDNTRLINAFDDARHSIKIERAYWPVEHDRDRYYPPAEHDGKPPEPPKKKVLERVPLDESWKTLDIQDIMQEQSLLRQAIVSAIDDGDVDKKELEMIMRYLRRARIDSEKQELVREALGDGEMDDDDRALLMSICPPSPAEDWDRMLVILEEEQGFIKTVFRFYCMEGSQGKSEASSMTLIQFGKFVKAAKILAKGMVDLGQCDRIFLRANQDRSEGLENLLAKPRKGKKMKEVVNKDNELVVHEFAAAIIRLAHARYREFASIEQRLKKLIHENIKKYAMAGAIDDSFSARLEEPEPAMVLEEARPKLKRIFSKASASDTTLGSTDASATVDMAEWLQMCERCDLITPAFTIREARGIFVQVNLDDELFIQEEQGNNADELVYDEFEECLCRAALELYPEDDEHSLSDCLRSFFEVFLPYATEVYKGKVK